MRRRGAAVSRRAADRLCICLLLLLLLLKLACLVVYFAI